MPTKSELLLAKRAVQAGHLDQDQILSVLSTLDRRRGGGEAIALGDLLVAEGFLAPTDLAALDGPAAAPTTELEETCLERPTTALDPASTVTQAGRTIDPLIGRTLGPSVRIVRQIGQGGMGAVYLGRHLGLDKEVVVKILPASLTRDPVLVERFLREARASARLDHPNVVHVYDVGTTDDNVHYITMEYVDGTDLEGVLRSSGGPLPLDQALGCATDIARALSAAHAASIVHRDIKPANVLVGKDGRARVTDFGLAHDKNDDSNLSRPGQMMGTPYFMSPEQCEGKAVDERSDLYSLGAVLYNLVTGRRLFTGEGAASILVAHLNESPVPPSAIRPDLPPAVEQLILRMVAKDAGDRPASAEEVVAELERLSASPPGPGDRVRRPIDRRLVAAAGVALVALVTLVALVPILVGGGDGDGSNGGEPDRPMPAAADSGEEFDRILAWRGDHPGDDDGFRSRLEDFVARFPAAAETPSARRALEDLAGRRRDRNASEARRRVEGLGQTAPRDLIASVEEILTEIERDPELAVAFLDETTRAIEEERLLPPLSGLRGRAREELRRLALDAIARQRSRFEEFARAAGADRLRAAGRAIDAARLLPADALRRSEILAELTAAGIAWSETPDRVELRLDPTDLDPASTPRPLTDLLATTWSIRPTAAGDPIGRSILAGDGPVVLDEIRIDATDLSGAAVVGLAPGDPAALLRLGLDGDGTTAIALEIGRHPTGGLAARPVRLDKAAAGFADDVAALPAAGRPLGEAGRFDAPAGRFEVDWRTEGDDLLLAVRPPAGDPIEWRVGRAAAGLDGPRAVRLWAVAVAGPAHLARLEMAGRPAR